MKSIGLLQLTPIHYICISGYLMPNYDLSSANLGRVANQPVDMLRIADQIVWQASVAPPEPTYTIFDGAALVMASFDDLNPNSWVANQFRRALGVDYEIVDVGLYVPAGSSLLGRTGNVGVMLKSTPYGTGFTYPNQMMVLGGATSAALIEGWNWNSLPSPVLWTDSFPYALGGYTISPSHYLFNNTLTENGISSPSLLFDLSPTNADGQRRSWFTPTSSSDFNVTTARSYGIDLRIRLA